METLANLEQSVNTNDIISSFGVNITDKVKKDGKMENKEFFVFSEESFAIENKIDIRGLFKKEIFSNDLIQKKRKFSACERNRSDISRENGKFEIRTIKGGLVKKKDLHKK